MMINTATPAESDFKQIFHFHFITYSLGVEPVVTHQTAWLESTGVCVNSNLLQSTHIHVVQCLLRPRAVYCCILCSAVHVSC